MSHSLVTKDILSVVVALGLVPKGNTPPRILGTGVLVNYQGFSIVVTVKHVIKELSKLGDYCIFNNSKDGKIVMKKFSMIKANTKQDWIFHPNSRIDLAVNFFPFNPEIDMIKIIPSQLFAKFGEIEIGSEAYVFGYPFGISTIHSVVPIVRSALIAGKSFEGHYFIDAPIFEGNSGGPIFLRPTIQRSDGNIIIGGPSNIPKFVGLVKSTLQTPNGQSLHLSEIVGVEKLIELFNSLEFNEVVQKLKEKIRVT